MKNLQIVLIFSAIIFAMGQNDICNPLQSKFGISGELIPTLVENLQYCTELDDSLACCSAETISGFNAKFQQNASDFESQIRTTDQAYSDAVLMDYPKLQDNWTTFNNYLDTIRNFNETLYNLTVTKYNYLLETTNNLTNAVDELVDDFDDYQEDRSNCYETMLDLEASAHCLACNPNWITFGVGLDGTVPLAPSVCDRLKAACFEYVQGTSQMSLFAAIKPVQTQVEEAVTALEGLGVPGIGEGPTPNITITPNTTTNETNTTTETSNNGTITETTTNTTINQTQIDYDAIADRINQIQPTEADFSNKTINMTRMPNQCTSEAECNWICETAFQDGKINTQALLRGGALVQQWTNAQIANLSSQVSGRRLLQADENDEGVDVAGSGGQEEEDNNNDDDDFLAPNGVIDTEDGGEEGEELIPGVFGDGDWEPASGESGIVVDIDLNPANVEISESQTTDGEDDGDGSSRPPVIPGAGERLVVGVSAFVVGIFYVLF